jgi:F0F1-type ATP synthase gamma subunit
MFMDMATRNGEDMVVELQRTLNTIRQKHITRELMDIVNGAEAVR